MNILAQPTISLEILHQLPIHCWAKNVTTLKEDIFIFCEQEGQQRIKVYDRNSMAEVTDIWLPATHLMNVLSFCSMSNCVYALLVDMEWECQSMLCITKDEGHKFHVSPWICDPELPDYSVSISVNGSLIFHSIQDGQTHGTLSVYDTDGSLLNKIMLTKVDPCFGTSPFDSVIHKSNGKLMLIYGNDESQIELAEIDAEGNVERNYKSSLTACGRLNFADTFGRIFITDACNRVELLDSEFNLLDSTGPRLNVGQNTLCKLHYYSERNEVVSIHFESSMSSVLTIFRFKEE